MRRNAVAATFVIQLAGMTMGCNASTTLIGDDVLHGRDAADLVYSTRSPFVSQYGGAITTTWVNPNPNAPGEFLVWGGMVGPRIRRFDTATARENQRTLMRLSYANGVVFTLAFLGLIMAS